MTSHESAGGSPPPLRFFSRVFPRSQTDPCRTKLSTSTATADPNTLLPTEPDRPEQAFATLHLDRNSNVETMASPSMVRSSTCPPSISLPVDTDSGDFWVVEDLDTTTTNIDSFDELDANALTLEQRTSWQSRFRKSMTRVLTPLQPKAVGVGDNSLTDQSVVGHSVGSVTRNSMFSQETRVISNVRRPKQRDVEAWSLVGSPRYFEVESVPESADTSQVVEDEVPATLWGRLRQRTSFMVICLICILVLAIITVVVSAVAAGAGGGGGDDIAAIVGRGNATVSSEEPTQAPAGFQTPTSLPLPSIPPSSVPSMRPSDSSQPSISPTSTQAPTQTKAPTSAPSQSQLPTTMPVTNSPSSSPTTGSPSAVPSLAPSTSSPSVSPSRSAAPSYAPSHTPTVAPSSAPSTPFPTQSPSDYPSASPTTSFPSASPTSFLDSIHLQLLGSRLESGQNGDNFGWAVTLSSNGLAMAIGAPLSGRNNHGSVYIYRLVNGQWLPRGQHIIDGEENEDRLGSAVALSHDGNVLAVSEPLYDGRRGRVRVYRWNSTDYEPMGTALVGPNRNSGFGLSVALSGDGDRMIVGAPLSGTVRVFQWQVGDWEPIGPAMNGDEMFDFWGWDVDISEDGSTVAAGAPQDSEYGGYVRVYRWIGSTWLQAGNTLLNSVQPVDDRDQFGTSLSLYGNHRIAVGAPYKDSAEADDSGAVMVYQYDGTDWALFGNAIFGEPSDDQHFGTSVALDGDLLAVGIPGFDSRGKVEFYGYTSGDWQGGTSLLGQQTNRDNFGWSVSLASQDWIVLAVGATGTGRDPAGSVSVYFDT